MGKLIAPDFIQIPREILMDQRLTPLDRILYGYIYWFSKLKNERCTASNETLAELCGVTNPQVISNGLNRLEKQEFIKRLYNDANRRKRSEIIPLVYYIKIRSDTLDNVTDTLDNVSPDTLDNVENKNIINKNNKEENTLVLKKENQLTKIQFFQNPIEQTEILTWLIGNGVEETRAKQEIMKFVSYWTETDDRGKERWRAQKFFDVKRRFVTWMTRANGNFNPKIERKRQWIK